MKKIIAAMISLCILGVCVWTQVLGNDPLQPAIASKILRFHVLANSDSEVDQAIKEEVRDAVGNYLQPLLAESESLEETKEIINKNMDNIIAISQNTLGDAGFDYDVSACITTANFPEKTYGSYTFPKGEYEALQITLGEGEGYNWWCVLYPNMCFYGSVYEVVEDEAGEALRAVLTPWEFADVFDSNNVEMRFKFLEYFAE